MTAESGGGAFVLIYILSVIFLALPIMCAEILIGKRGKQNPVNTLRTLSTEASYYTQDESDLHLNRTVKVKKQFENNDLFSNWELVGWMGITAGVLILSFYSVIAGWTLSYIIKSISGSFALITAAGSASKFETLGLDRLEPRSHMHLKSYQHHPVKFLSRVKLHVAERLSNRDWLKIPNRALPDLALRKIQEQIYRLDEAQLQPSTPPLGADSAGGYE